MAVRVEGAEIVLTGMVGESYWEDGFTPGEVLAALAQVGRETDIVVRLNSGGGYATDGAAIHAAFVAHPGKVKIIVEGIAASAASLIAMAGDETVMSLGAVMMIHDPASITWGTAADHQKTIEMLNALATSYAGVYASKTGGTAEAMRTLMRAETWMTAEEAVAQKFADSAAASNDNQPAEPTAFAYGIYAKAPRSITALADAKGWKPRGVTMAAPPAPTRQTKEIEMTDTNQPAPKSTGADEAKARMKSILMSDEAKGREAMANHLAFETDTTADAAIALMKVAPKAEASASGGDEPGETFAERKARMDRDGLGDPGQPPAKPKADWKSITDRRNASLKRA